LTVLCENQYATEKVPDKLAEFGHQQCHTFSSTDDLIISTGPLLHIHVQSMCCHLQQPTHSGGIHEKWLCQNCATDFTS